MNELSKKSALHADCCREWRSHPQSMLESQTWPVQHQDLGPRRVNLTAQLDVPFIRWRQHDIGAVNGPEFLQDGAWAVAKPGPLLPLLQSLPAHLGLDQVGPVLPNGTQGYVASLNAEGGLRVGELDVGAPELFRAPVRNVGASPVAALAPTSLVFSLEPHRPGKLNTRRSDGAVMTSSPYRQAARGFCTRRQPICRSIGPSSSGRRVQLSGRIRGVNPASMGCITGNRNLWQFGRCVAKVWIPKVATDLRLAAIPHAPGTLRR